MKQKVGTRQNSPSNLAPGCLRNAVKSISSPLPQDCGQSHSVCTSVSESHSCSSLGAITEDTAGPCVHGSERRRAEQQLNFSWLLLKATSPLPSWEASARAISLYCPRLNGDSDGFQAGRSSLSKILHRYQMQLFGDILKQKEIKDRTGCGSWKGPWGGGAAAGPALSWAGADTERGSDRREALTSSGPQQNQ